MLVIVGSIIESDTTRSSTDGNLQIPPYLDLPAGLKMTCNPLKKTVFVCPSEC